MSTPKPAPTPLAMSPMRRSANSRVCGVKVRTVPRSSALRDDIVGAASVQLRYRHHERLVRSDVAADDGLERGDNLGSGDQRIDGQVRHGGMSAVPCHLYPEEI